MKKCEPYELFGIKHFINTASNNLPGLQFIIENTRPTWNTGSTSDPLIIEITHPTWNTGSASDPLIKENTHPTWNVLPVIH